MPERPRFFKKPEFSPNLPGETEMDFLNRNAKTLERFYAGRWVALIGGAVLAGKDEYKLEMKARSLGAKRPLLVYIHKPKSILILDSART